MSRLQIKLIPIAILSIVLLSTSANAQEAAPGDTCAVAGAYTKTGGPELGGAGHVMVCSGGVWTGIISHTATGGAQLTNALSFTSEISPASIGANQNDYAPTGHASATVMRITASGAFSITGLQGGADGRVLTIINAGANSVTLKNQDAASTAANRFAFSGDIVISPDKTVGLIYDATSQRWRAGGGLPFEPGLSGPSACPSIGDLCPDGTVFAGYHPILHEHLFIPPTDQGTTAQWKTSTGSNDIATDTDRDGRINTNQVANSTTFPAFKTCKDLGFGGHSDWYLPAREELNYLASVRPELVAAGHITNFQFSTYWSSTEYSSNQAILYNFSNRNLFENTKTVGARTRCVRRS